MPEFKGLCIAKLVLNNDYKLIKFKFEKHKIIWLWKITLTIKCTFYVRIMMLSWSFDFKLQQKMWFQQSQARSNGASY